MEKNKEEIRRIRNLIENVQRDLNDLRNDIKKIEQENKEIESNIRQTKREYDEIRLVMEELVKSREGNEKRLYEKHDEEIYLKKQLNKLLIGLEQIKNQD